MTSMKIDVKRVAELANLPLSKTDEERLSSELSQTLDYIATLESIDTKKIEPTSQVTGLTNVLREDMAAPSLTQDQALQNAKATHNGFFKVAVILDQG